MPQVELTSAPPAGPGEGVRPPASLAVVALFVLAVAVLAAAMFRTALQAPDEIRVAEIAREMAQDGDVLVPKLGGRPFLEYPPLYYAAAALSFRVFGVSDAAARLPSVLASLATLWLAWDMGRRVAGRRAGLLSALVLLTLLGFHRYSGRSMVDATLLAAVSWGYWGWLRLLLAERAGRPLPAGAVLVPWLAGGLAFLVKGPVGPVLLFAPIVVHLVAFRRPRLFAHAGHLAGFAAFAALCLAWPLLLYRHAGPAVFDGWWLQNVVWRVAPQDGYVGGHRAPWWDYLASFSGLLLPWVIVMPAAWAWALRARPAGPDRSVLAALAIAFPLGLAILSLAGTKRTLYLLPLIAPCAVLTGTWLDSLGARRALSRLERGSAVLLAAVGALPALALAPLAVLLRRVLAAASGDVPSPARPDELRLRDLVAGGGPDGAARREALAGLGPRLGWTFAVVALVANLLAPVFDDGEHDLRGMAYDLRAMGTLADSLAGFRLDERSTAVVPFYTGHVVEDLREPGEVRDFAGRDPGAQLLVDMRVIDKLDADVRARMIEVRQWNFGRKTYALFAFAAAGGGD